MPTSPFNAAVEVPRKRFEVGDRVSHDRYGLGRTIGIEADSDVAVLVDFGSHQRRITQPYTELHKL